MAHANAHMNARCTHLPRIGERPITIAPSQSCYRLPPPLGQVATISSRFWTNTLRALLYAA